MKRLALIAIGLYVLAAIVTRLAEATGSRQCGCHADCWCKKPGLSLFRWVVPRRVHHVWTAGEKRAFAEAASAN